MEVKNQPRRFAITLGNRKDSGILESSTIVAEPPTALEKSLVFMVRSLSRDAALAKSVKLARSVKKAGAGSWIRSMLFKGR